MSLRATMSSETLAQITRALMMNDSTQDDETGARGGTPDRHCGHLPSRVETHKADTTPEIYAGTEDIGVLL